MLALIGAANAQTFSGFTDGCFGGGCIPVADPSHQSMVLMTSIPTGLSFHHSSFSAAPANGFLGLASTANIDPALNFNNLGSFTLGGTPHDYTGERFGLRVTFTAPVGILPTPSPVFNDILMGTVISENVGGVMSTSTGPRLSPSEAVTMPAPSRSR